MNGLTKQKKGYGNRVWEVDLLRGILILFVVFDHVMFDIGAMFADSFSTPLGIRISDWAAGYVFESSAFGLLAQRDSRLFHRLFCHFVGSIRFLFQKQCAARA